MFELTEVSIRNLVSDGENHLRLKRYYGLRYSLTWGEAVGTKE